MYNDELMHAATRIMANRAEQLGISEDELMHYGRKGMKWGEDIFAQDPRANQAAQALNRANFDLQIKNKKQADLENKKNDFLLKAKKEQLLRNAKSGNGNGAEHPQGGQNWATKDEVNKRHSELENKKNELLSKARSETHNNNKNSIISNKEYFSDIKSVSENKANNIFKNSELGKQYSDLHKDIQTDKMKDVGTPLGEDAIKGDFSSNSMNKKKNNSLNAIEDALKNKAKKELYDDIDAHSEGISDQTKQLAKISASGYVDAEFDNYKKELSNAHKPWNDENVGKAAKESGEKIGRNYALSTGGLHANNSGLVTTQQYKNEVMDKDPLTNPKKFDSMFKENIDKNIKEGKYFDTRYRYTEKDEILQRVQEQADQAVKQYYELHPEEALTGDTSVADVIYKAANERLEELYKIIDKHVDKLGLP